MSTNPPLNEAQSVYVKTCMHPFSSTKSSFYKWFDIQFAMFKTSLVS